MPAATVAAIKWAGSNTAIHLPADMYVEMVNTQLVIVHAMPLWSYKKFLGVAYGKVEY